MHRSQVLLITLSGFFGSIWLSGGQVKISYQCASQLCLVSVSTSIAAVIIGMFIIAFVIKFSRHGRVNTQVRAGLGRRFAAFVLDMMAVLIALTPIFALPAVWLEYVHTGVFHWAFQRDYRRATDDWTVVLSVVVLVAALIYYFYYYTINNQATLGQYVMGYKVVSMKGEMHATMAIKRLMYSMIGLCIWPIAVVHGLIKRNVFMWDSRSQSIAILTVPISQKNQAFDGD